MKRKTYKPLDELIEKTGLKVKVIAKKIGVDASTFYKWRVSPNIISLDNLEKLSDVLGVTFFDLYDIVKKFNNEVD